VPTSKGGEAERGGEGRKKGEGREREGRGRAPPFVIPGYVLDGNGRLGVPMGMGFPWDPTRMGIGFE